MAPANPQTAQRADEGVGVPPAVCPPLEEGVRLTRAEFERRYEARPDLKKVELIEGVVYMGSPVRIKSHSRPHGMILSWIGVYSSATPGTDFGDNGSLRLDLGNEPQPDAYLRIKTSAGGRSRIDADDYLEGVPELVVEIAASSASIDLGPKRDAYQRNGVPEYLVWRFLDQALDWWHLVAGEYQPLPPDANGIIEGHVFPGLRLAPAPLLADNLRAVLDQLQRGLQSDAHRTFVERLASRKQTHAGTP